MSPHPRGWGVAVHALPGCPVHIQATDSFFTLSFEHVLMAFAVPHSDMLWFFNLSLNTEIACVSSQIKKLLL